MPAHPLRVAIAADGRLAYEIGAAAGCNPSLLSKLANGRERPSNAMAQRLAEALGVPREQLFADLPSADAVTAERTRQGLPKHVEDRDALAKVTRSLRPQAEATR